jgi:hypothetical protein
VSTFWKELEMIALEKRGVYPQLAHKAMEKILTLPLMKLEKGASCVPMLSLSELPGKAEQ